MQTWHLSVWWPRYLVYCLVVTVVVRFVVCFFKVLEYRPSKMFLWGFEPFREILWDCLLGMRNAPEPARDYLMTALIGFFEAAAYPILIHANELQVIGGWLAIKTAGNWSQWANSRATFCRYLLGNLMVLLISYAASVWFVIN